MIRIGLWWLWESKDKGAVREEEEGKHVATHCYCCCCICEAHHDSQAKIYVSCADVIIIMCRQRLRPRRQVKNCYNLMATFQSVARQRDAAVDATTQLELYLCLALSLSQWLSLSLWDVLEAVVSILCDTKLCFIVVSPNLECDFCE